MKLLLHICCGPCAAYPVKFLKDNNIDFEGYYYNPNIQPIEEFIKRKENLKLLSQIEGFNVHYNDAFMQNVWENYVASTDSRCEMCYRLRLDETAKFARDNGFDSFSTTLLISPYQDHELIIKIAEEKAEKYGVKFYYHDFRPNYREGQNLAREHGLYRQKYCGCICSLSGNGK